MEKKKIYLILVGIAGVACITFFFLFFLNFVGKKTDLAILKNIANNNSGEETGDLGTASTTGESGLTKEEQQKKDYSKNYLAAKDANDPGLCAGIGTDSMVDNCILLVVRKSLKIEACASLKNKDKIASCEDMVHYEKAVAGNSPAECDLISASSLVNHCVINLINAKGYKRSDCSLFSETSRASCESYHNYLEEIELSMNPKKSADCEKITGEPARTFCFQQFGVK